jgi:hypothetical protein
LWEKFSPSRRIFIGSYSLSSFLVVQSGPSGAQKHQSVGLETPREHHFLNEKQISPLAEADSVLDIYKNK